MPGVRGEGEGRDKVREGVEVDSWVTVKVDFCCNGFVSVTVCTWLFMPAGIESYSFVGVEVNTVTS